MVTDQFRPEIERGEDLFQNGKIEEALKVFESVLEKEPDNMSALNDKGVALNNLQRYEEAIQTFSEILHKGNRNSNAVFNLISNYFAAGKWKEAQSVLDKFQHCLAENDIRMIEDDLRKFRSKNGSMSDSSMKTIVTFSLGSKACQYDFKLSLDLNQFFQKIIWNFISKGDLYEPETSLFIENVITAGDCVVDIGAHIGYFSILASKIVGENGTVFSFEPERNNFNQLNHNITLNDLENIRTFNLALSSEDREGELFVNSDNDGGHAL